MIDLPTRLQRLFEALHAADLRWCLLRPRELLAQPQGDIDLLVQPADVPASRAVLLREGFVPLGPAGTGTDVHALDFDRASARFLWIHMQTELEVAGRSFSRGRAPPAPDTRSVSSAP
jgi:hypothetical protein